MAGSRFAQLAFTPLVRAHQRAHGSDRAYSRMLEEPVSGDRIGPFEQEFIAARESLYLATVGETGWPYIQHRGGPSGFLRVLDETTLGFADFRGNRQYISRGNLDHDDRVALFLMDYVNLGRLKILGRARVVEVADDPDLIKQLTVAGYKAKVERGIVIHVEAFDWNCSQHIPQMFPADAVREAVGRLQERVERLKLENEKLRALH